MPCNKKPSYTVFIYGVMLNSHESTTFRDLYTQVPDRISSKQILHFVEIIFKDAGDQMSVLSNNLHITTRLQCVRLLASLGQIMKLESKWNLTQNISNIYNICCWRRCQQKEVFCFEEWITLTALSRWWLGWRTTARRQQFADQRDV